MKILKKGEKNELTNGGLAEWTNASVLETDRACHEHAFIRPNRMPAAIVATLKEASTSFKVFIHTAEAIRTKQPLLYAFAVCNPREENTQ